MLQTIIHYTLHLVFPALLAFVFFKNNWKQAYLIMLATMLVDLDHLLANPIFDPNRCSVNFHPLHTYYAVAIYFIGLFIPSQTAKFITKASVASYPLRPKVLVIQRLFDSLR